MARYLYTSSSKKTGGTFLLDSRTGESRQVLGGPGRGVTRGPGGDYFVISGYRNPEEGVSTLHRLRPGDWTAEKVGDYELADCHDLRWIDGHFYLAASLGNQVVRLDAGGRVLDRMQIVPDDRDICHVNCLVEWQGAILCSIFTLSPGERTEKRLTGAWHTEGKILRLDYPRETYEVLFEPLGQPHSLVPHDGALYLVESHRSAVTRVDLAARTKRILRQYTGFVRGLAFGPGEAVVGVCIMYHRDRRRLRPLPFHLQLQERLFPFSGLLVVDTKSWRTRRRIPLPGAEVYEILPLDEEAAPAR